MKPEEQQQKLVDAKALFDQKIDELQKRLGEMQFGEAAQVRISDEWYLSYEYYQKNWMLVARNHKLPWLQTKKDRQNKKKIKVAPLKRCNYDVKLAAVEKMPNLFRELGNVAQKAAERTEEAAKKVQEILDRGIEDYLRPPKEDELKDFKQAFNAKMGKIDEEEVEEKKEEKKDNTVVVVEAEA